jgi:hypothetical protein
MMFMKKYSLFLLIALLINLAVLMPACTNRSPAPASTQKVTIRPTEAQSLQTPAALTQAATGMIGSEEARADIFHAIQAFQGVKAFRYQGVTTIDGKDHKTLFEKVNPDRIHIQTEGMEIIILGTKVYLKQPSGWTEEPNFDVSAFREDFFENVKATLSQPQFNGVQELNGKAMRVYYFQYSTKIGEEESINKCTLWVSIDDGLSYRIEIDGLVASMDAQTGKIVGKPALSTVMYEYDPNLRIEAPQITP